MGWFVASFTGDGAYDQNNVYGAVMERNNPDAAVIVPPRCTAVPSETAETDPTHDIPLEYPETN
jgi:hypothetical protein